MEPRERLVKQALAILAEAGEEGFSTRLVCEKAGVTAPTLYHHFGDADGLIAAAIEKGFEEFLERKKRPDPEPDAARRLRNGWLDYLAFARERPRLYGMLCARLLMKRDLPAAKASRAILLERLGEVARNGRLKLPLATAADIIWASVHGAALLAVTAHPAPPDPAAIEALYRSAFHQTTKHPPPLLEE